jgi:hypothetical protein
MYVQNMTSKKGTIVPNQFIITHGEAVTFQSYNSVIAVKQGGRVTLGKNWDYSKTTAKYRNQFLNETTKETQAKLDSGEYTLDANL